MAPQTQPDISAIARSASMANGAVTHATRPSTAAQFNATRQGHGSAQSHQDITRDESFDGEFQCGNDCPQPVVLDCPAEPQEHPVLPSGTAASLASEHATSAPKVSRSLGAGSRKKIATPKRDVDTWRYKNGLHEGLPPIDNIHDIVRDMVNKDLAAFQYLQDHLNGHTLQVATLCSGTESPILFLTELVAALEERGVTLQFKHCFSAEIEPFKQAYIESNFHPPLLFRDITQFGVDEKPETAYGTRAELPGSIDLLVAGFSCVDFSNLNSYKKRLDDDGQSGETARAVLRYAKKANVPLVILENIASAPWAQLKKYWNKGGYSTLHVKVDTKDYYIPHTRQRGYMICISNSLSSTGQGPLSMLRDWESYMTKFKRPASSPFQDFLLDPDDPQLRKALAEFNYRSISRGNVSWVRYEARHLYYRRFNVYGLGKPSTEWKRNGCSTMIEFGQWQWLLNEVNRVKDTFDICTLRATQRGYDIHSKCAVIDFSQGVDRQTDTTPAGLISCVTPSGAPFSTMRAGLITGIEALRLQGIPTEELSLTRESQRELHNMAGNAMSTTVVGAAIVSGLIAAMCALPRGSGVRAQTPPALSNSGFYYGLDRGDGLQLIEKTISTCIIETMPAKTLMNLAAETVAQCLCEGFTNFANQDLLVCKSCNYTACKNCRGKPYHVFVESKLSLRTNPFVFTTVMKRVLHMCFHLSEIFEDFKLPTCTMPTLDVYWDTIQQSTQEELRFSEIKRSHQEWIMVFNSSTACLKLKVSSSSIKWLYYAKPLKTWPCNSKERKMLEYPVACMNVEGEDLIKGQWKVRWPDIRTLDIIMTQSHDVQRVPGWRAKQGLPEFLSDRVPMGFSVSTNGQLPKIDGNYTHLPDCGTACNLLYVQGSASGSPMYFFLDPSPFGDPKEDRFVFSRDPRRVVPGQTRPVAASIGQINVTQWLLSSVNRETFKGARDQWWLKTTAKLTPINKDIAITSPAQHFEPLQTVSMRGSQNCTDKLTPVLTCTVPGVKPTRGAWKSGPWLEVTNAWQSDVFSSAAWVTSRCADLDGLFNERRFLNLQNLGTECKTCAPKPIQLKWKCEGAVYQPYEDPKGAKDHEAAIKNRPKGIVAFTRLDPQGQGNLLLGIHVTTLAHQALASLLSAGRFENGVPLLAGSHQDQPEVSWALDTQYSTDIEMPRTLFSLKNNQDDPEMNHVFKHADKGSFDIGADDAWPPELRPEQARSLHWMINQESPNAEPFVEEETEEMLFPPLGWRMDTRAARKRQIWGGIIADGVGYGKTITTLALIESQKAPHPVAALNGRISLKATLILVTAGTLPQWHSEATRFLGRNATVLVFKDLSSLKKSSVAEFKAADLIIAPHALITGLTYLDRFSQFAALPAAPASSRSRAFAAWADFANARTAQHIAELQASCFPKVFGSELSRRRGYAELDKDLHERVPCKGRASDQAARKGSNLSDQAAGEGSNPTDQAAAEGSNPNDQAATEGSNPMAGGNEEPSKKRKLDENEQELRFPEKSSDPFNLNKAKSLDDICGPLFEMFEYHRLVVDEFTYLTSKDRVSIDALRSPRKWCLSGTPPLEDFSDIKRMASAVGVHLGRDDPDKKTMAARNVRELQKEQTKLEKFRWYANPHTRKWFERRFWIAQKFLDQFVRKNVPTVKVPQSIMQLKIVHLKLLERALYTELEGCLIENDMQSAKVRRTKYMDDRETRIFDALQAESEELGLLGAAMYLSPGTSNNFVGTQDDFDLILTVRKEHLFRLQTAITSILTRTARLYKDYMSEVHEDNHVGEARKAEKPTEYENWFEYLKSAKVGDVEVGKSILKMQPTIPDLPLDRDKLVAEAKRYLMHIVNSDNADLASQFSPSRIDDYYAKPKKPKLMAKLADPELDQRIVVLRELTTHLSILTTQYVKAFQAIRYLKAIGFLHDSVDETIKIDCEHIVYCRTGHINTACGHIVCPRCVEEAIEVSTCNKAVRTSARVNVNSANTGATDAGHDDVPLCIVTGCNAHMTDVRPVNKLLVKGGIPNKVKNFRGSKINEIVRLIKDVIPPDDQVIVFVQDDRIMKKIGDALTEDHVMNHAITESIARSAKAGEWIQQFRKRDDTKGLTKVLLLNSANETCAGSNLQNAHHVIFVAPLHATSDYDYTASETQCLGRASRKGQKQTVQLYRFLALNTIDVDILEARTAKKVVRADDGRWVLKDKQGMSGFESKQDWGTRIGRDFLPGRLNEACEQ